MRKYRVLLGLFFALSVLSRQITGASGAQVEIFNQDFLNQYKTFSSVESPHITQAVKQSNNNYLSNLFDAEKQTKVTIYKKYKHQEFITIEQKISYVAQNTNLKKIEYEFAVQPNKLLIARSLSPPYISDSDFHSLIHFLNGGITNRDYKKVSSIGRFCVFCSRAF